MSIQPGLRLRTLGSLTLSAGDTPLNGSATVARRLALLSAIAAVEPDAAVSRDTLLLLFWPDRTDERARSALKQLTFAIRKSLDRDDLFIGSDALRLNPELITSDVGDLLAAARRGDDSAVVATYGGPFLEGVHISDAPEFERWAAERRSAIDAVYRNARAGLAEEAERRGDNGAAIEHWAALAQHDPLSAQAVAGLATALARSGDGSRALKTIAAHATLVRLELDQEQETSLRDLADRIRAGGFAHTEPARQPPTPHAALAGVEPESVVAPARRTPPPRQRRFVGPIAIGLLAAVAITVAAVVRRVREPATKQSIVVLAVIPSPRDSVVERWGRAAVDEISTALAEAQLGRLVEIRSSGFSGAGRGGAPLADDVSAMQFARASGASFALLAAISREADTLEFRAKLIDVSAGRILRVVAPLRGTPVSTKSNIQELRQRAAGAVVTVFDRRTASVMSVGSPAPLYQAYGLFVSGLTEFEADRYDEAAKLFDRAHDRDTTFMVPLIWSNFAVGNQLRTDKHDSLTAWLATQRERFAKPDQYGIDMFVARQRHDAAGALDALRRASAELPGSEWSFNLAATEFESGNVAAARGALSLVDPVEGWARGWGVYWRYAAGISNKLGQGEDFLALVRRARASLPAVNSIAVVELYTLYQLGRETEFWRALREFEAVDWSDSKYNAAFVMGGVLERPRSDRSRHSIAEECVRWLREPRPIATMHWIDRTTAEAECLYQADRYEESAALWRRLVDSIEAHAKGADSAMVRRYDRSMLGVTLALNGRREQAEAIKRDIPKLPPSGSPVNYSRQMARLAAALGDRDEAMDFALQTRMCCGRPHPTGLVVSAFDPVLVRFRSDSAVLDAFGFPGVRFTTSGDTVPWRK
jgi:DNA-binding SARP family transcriptional activator